MLCLGAVDNGHVLGFDLRGRRAVLDAHTTNAAAANCLAMCADGSLVTGHHDGVLNQVRCESHI